MNHTLVAAERHIAGIENRIARQSALIEERARSGLDTQHAARTLRVLEQALDRTREHTRTLLVPAQGATYEAPVVPCVLPLRKAAVEPLESWESPLMRVAQLAWGEGCSKPGGIEYLMDLARPLALDSTKSVMEFGAGLGAGARAIHRRFGSSVVGYEIGADLARAARQLSVLARLEKAVDIVRYDPQGFAPRPGSHDCILSTETLYQIERKEDLLIKLELGLKPRGQIVMTDLVLGPGISADDARLKALAPAAAVFWPASRYVRHFQARNFSLQDSEDMTGAYRKLIIDGCRRFVEGRPELVANAKVYPEATFALLELCESRVAAFDSGLLKVMCFSAIKPSGLKLMSDW